MVSASISREVRVTLRNRSDWVPTNPTIHVSGPLARTVSTLIGSLKSVPVRIWSGLRIFSVTDPHLSIVLGYAPIKNVPVPVSVFRVRISHTASILRPGFLNHRGQRAPDNAGTL